MEDKKNINDSLVPVPEDIAPADEGGDNLKKGKKKKPKKDIKLKLKYRTRENDIRYRAPLSYRHLRILGWIFMAITQLGLVYAIAQKIDTRSGFDYDTARSIVSLFSSFPFALFILANFGIILRNRKNFKYLFVFYGGVMLALYFIANIVVLHYVYGTFRTINPGLSFQDVALVTGTFLMGMGNMGYMFNLFVDLFLCVLTVFFIFYCPKNKYFQGKKVIFFRMLVIIPIAYEVASIIIKQYAFLGNIMIPSYVFFLLTSKPPLTFAAFFIITLILKIREYKFLKLYNFDNQLLEEHTSTNAHALRTSITIAVVFLVISNIDILVLLIYTIATVIKEPVMDEDLIMETFFRGQAIGFGGSSPLFVLSPLALIYSYTKTHKNKKFDSFLPLIGIGLVLFTFIEGLYLTLRFTVFEYLHEMLDSYSGLLDEGDGDFENLEAIKSRVPIQLVAIKDAAYNLIHLVR